MAKSVTAPRKASSAGTDVELGSGNVFADLGLDSPDERQLRVKLAIRLNDLITAEGLTQAAAAKRLGLAQPHISELKNYKLSRYSSERLMHLITLLNRDVEIFIRPRTSPVTGGRKSITAQVGQVSVWAAA
jgi:predicted XRE-type DNA-binding protein